MEMLLSVPLLIFKPIYHLARNIRRIRPAKEKSIFLPTLFDKLGQDIWIDNEKLKSAGLRPTVNLKESMKRYETFIVENPWYAQQKFGFAL